MFVCVLNAYAICNVYKYTNCVYLIDNCTIIYNYCIESVWVVRSQH